MVDHIIQETIPNLSRIGISVGPETTGPAASPPKPLEGLREECYQGSPLIMFFFLPFVFEQEEDEAPNPQQPVGGRHFSVLLLQPGAESQKPGSGRRAGIGELHSRIHFPCGEGRGRERTYPPELGKDTGLLCVICLLAWISPVERVSLSVFHILIKIVNV